MAEKSVLEIRGLCVSVEGKEILKGVDLTVKQGEIHAIMGPNGSGKSTLSLALAGHPKYVVTGGDARLDGESLLGMLPNERAKKGLFLAFQYPSEIQGVHLSNFLRIAYNSLHAAPAAKTSPHGAAALAPLSPMEFQKTLKAGLGELHMSDDFLKRYLNHGFSGGEKKRTEVLQMGVLKPRIAVLDEIDSGLDIDALKVVAQAVKAHSKDTGFIIVTHYQRILKHLNPDHVHIMVDGRIVKSGGHELAARLEESGYGGLLKSLGIEYKEMPDAAPAA